MKRQLPLWLLLCPFLLFAEQEELSLEPNELDAVLNHLIRQQLTRYHFDREERPIDDDYSKDVYELFLSRVDPQKRLLLKKDVEGMKTFEISIDDDLKKGEFHLPAMAATAVNVNLDQLEPFIQEVLAKGFDYEQEEHFETDPEKIDYCESIEALQDRWRRHLKYQCLGTYLSLRESEESMLGSGNASVASGNAEGKGEDALVTSGDGATEEAIEVMVETSVEEGAVSSNVTMGRLSKEGDLALREKSRNKTLKQIESYFRRLRELTHQDHYARYFNSITAGFDPHTNYMDPYTKEDFGIKMSKSLEGIGAVLQEEDDFTKVVRIVPGSASYQQGELQAGDIILRVAEGIDGDEIDVTGMRLRNVVTYIRGEKGTTVRLTVKKSNGQVQVIPIVRDIVKLEDQVARSTRLTTSDNHHVGYIYLPDFYRDHRNPNVKNCTADVRREVRLLKGQGIDGLILDLRGNGGGFLEDARSISGLFIERGPIVQVKDSFGRVEVHYDHDRRVEYDGPMIVMVDQFSASASEIVAAALQDYHRAVIIGTGQTHGKGTVQHLIQLNRFVPEPWSKKELGDLKLTIQKFYRINGGSTQHKGVLPDIVLPDAKTYLESGERYLDHALEWDHITEQKYREWGEAPPVAVLRSNSEERVTESPIFKAISERLERLKESSKETVVTLSAKEMIREREQNKKEAENYQTLLDELKKQLEPLAALDRLESEGADIELDSSNKEEGLEASQADSSGNLQRKKTPEELQREEFEAWVEGVTFDPYVREAMKVIIDMLAIDEKKKDPKKT